MSASRGLVSRLQRSIRHVRGSLTRGGDPIEPLGNQERRYHPDSRQQRRQPEGLGKSPLDRLDERPMETLQVLKRQSCLQGVALGDLERGQSLEGQLLREEVVRELSHGVRDDSGLEER